VIAASRNEHYSGHLKAQVKSDRRTSGKDLWRKICREQVSDRAKSGDGSMRQSWIEMSGLWCMLFLQRFDTVGWVF